VASLWPLAAVFNWFGVSIATLEQMSRTDPLGFRVFPALLMFARPALAGVTALLTPWAAIRVVTWHPTFAFGILIKTAIAQALLTVALAMTAAPVNAVLARLVPMFADRRTPGAIVSPAHFVLLQEAASDSILSPLLAIAVACAGLAVAARFMIITETVSETLPAPLPEPPSVATTIERSAATPGRRARGR
jgi:hypothetical protein